MHIHLTPAALAKAKALGIVAAALTAGGTGGMVALSQVANTSDTAVTVSADATATPTDTPTDTPTTAATTPAEAGAATDTGAAPAPTSTAYVLPSCPADVKNHGAYVSSVAKSAPRGAHGEHGAWVSQAAQSDCGKPTPGATDSPDTQDSPDAQHSPDTQDSPETEAPHTAAPKTATTEHHGHGHGHGHHGG